MHCCESGQVIGDLLIRTAIDKSSSASAERLFAKAIMSWTYRARRSMTKAIVLI